ncbi:MAG: hypothetical protein WCK86_11535 [Planctomycetia bacterium]
MLRSSAVTGFRRKTESCCLAPAQQQDLSAFTENGNRHGVLSLWTVLAISMAGILSLTVINLWLYSNTLLRARHCCESAALAAGHAWLSDDMLRLWQQPFETDARAIRATNAALNQADFYGGRPTIPTLIEDDVRFQWPEQTSLTASEPLIPSQIEVRYHGADNRYTHSAASFLPAASLEVGASIVIENQPVAFRVGKGQTIPILPLTLSDEPALDPAGTIISLGYWTRMIENSEGEDAVAWNPDTHLFAPGPDGLPEITLSLRTNLSTATVDELRPLQFRAISLSTNSSLVSNATFADDLARGISFEDLQSLGLSELALPSSLPTRNLTLSELQQVDSLLRRVYGRAFLFCLSAADSPATASTVTSPVPVTDRLSLTRVVAVRLVDVEVADATTLRIRFQPCVMATSLAVTSSDAVAPRNRYVYSVRLND